MRLQILGNVMVTLLFCTAIASCSAIVVRGTDWLPYVGGDFGPAVANESAVPQQVEQRAEHSLIEQRPHTDPLPQLMRKHDDLVASVASVRRLEDSNTNEKTIRELLGTHASTFEVDSNQHLIGPFRL